MARPQIRIVQGNMTFETERGALVERVYYRCVVDGRWHDRGYTQQEAVRKAEADIADKADTRRLRVT